MADGVDPGILDRAEQPVRELFFALLQAIMNRRDDVIGLRQDVVRKIQLPVFQNVHLDALQHAHIRQPFVERIDLLPLGAQLRRCLTGHRHARRVIGDGDVGVAQRPRRPGHLCQRRFAVAGVGVHL